MGAVSSTDPFTPVKRYPTYESPCSKKVKAKITPNGKQLFSKGGVYSWMGPDGRYIGYSSNPSARISSELSDANVGLRTKLGRAIKAQPNAFAVGMICNTDDPEEMASIETEGIKKKDSIQKGYNQRNGGGGGVAQASRKVSCAMTAEKASEIYRNNFVQPTWRQVLVKNGKLKNPLLSEEKNQRNRIYDILRISSDGTRTHYLGYTSTKVGARISTHLSHANNSHTAPKNRLYKDMRKHPSEFYVAIVPMPDELLEKVPLSMLETIAVDFFKGLGENVYNKNKGGGGGYARR